jgi:hypothetical protein
MRLETEDFVDQRLAAFEIVLDRVQRTVAVGRERLNGKSRTQPPPEPDPDPSGPLFFDQDRA